jgi:hypothetical protein
MNKKKLPLKYLLHLHKKLKNYPANVYDVIYDLSYYGNTLKPDSETNNIEIPIKILGYFYPSIEPKKIKGLIAELVKMDHIEILEDKKVIVIKSNPWIENE